MSGRQGQSIIFVLPLVKPTTTSVCANPLCCKDFSNKQVCPGGKTHDTISVNHPVNPANPVSLLFFVFTGTTFKGSSILKKVPYPHFLCKCCQAHVTFLWFSWVMLAKPCKALPLLAGILQDHSISETR